MKIRSGFVSNSSSSSFVLLGFESKEEIDEENVSRQVGFEIGLYYGGEDGLRHGQRVIGRTLAYGLDDYAYALEVDIAAEIEKVEKVKEFLGSDSPIRLWAGERMS